MFLNMNKIPKQKNVLGEDIEPCSMNPVTGWFRDGSCNTDKTDVGVHCVCAKVTNDFLNWCKENGNDLITPHPEYYSLIAGKRQPGTQLCLSNPEVLQVLIESLKNKIQEKPASTYWSVSQDDNDRYCQCDACKALNEKYGKVPSGSIIYFVNQVAKEYQ